MPRMDTSVSRTNARVKSGYANTGEVISLCLSSVNDDLQAKVHWKVLSLRDDVMGWQV